MRQSLVPDTAEPHRMSFLDHLRELRARLLGVFLALGLAFVCVFPFADRLFLLLTGPLRAAEGHAVSVIYTAPAEVFVAFMKMGIWAALVLASPVVFWQVWAFISPGLNPREKRLALPFVVLSSAFFLAGVLFGFFVLLPIAFRFFLTFSPEYISAQIRVSEYLSFTTRLLLACGAAFEFPLILAALVYLRVLRTASIAKRWRSAILIIAGFSALLTPPDVVTMLLLAAPLFALFGMSLIMCLLIERARKSGPS